MSNRTSFKDPAAVGGLARSLAGVLVCAALVTHAHAAATALGTEPFLLSTKINALPNVMYILDDSGSMTDDYLPDWAGPYQAMIDGVLTLVTPAHQFFNSAYNGVAYNPATRYRQPVMYTTTGALDTTTYPSQNGQSSAAGGDGSASAGTPNWRAVKVDGYGIQSVATVNLEGNAYSYSTVVGEYCDSAQLRNCVASATPTGVYTFPAKLRWCHDAALAVDTTANAGTTCQASNIADTPTNAANGVTTYTFPRMPKPSTATITVVAPGTVTGITVDSAQILSADATGGTSVDVAAAIVLQINACTFGVPALSHCTVVGFSAVRLNDVVTVTAPTGTTSTPVVTGGTTTPAAFSKGLVPGSSLFTAITPAFNSYPYPGTASKNSNRSDCAGSTCTYAEEMTNYANWYAYYRTRMQMMKTSASIAFSAVDDKFRVGYYSINNGAGGQFLNPGPFTGTQKNLWYSKFLSAVPYGATPLRAALANVGRMYAGQLNSSALNDVAVSEPMEYSCQQNFTILSTDGYWNDPSNPKQIDGSTDIGNQDGSLDRPYYDGATQTKTISQTLESTRQVSAGSLLWTQRTRQLQTNTSQLTQSVVTTTTWPYQLQTSTLQTRTTPLNEIDYGLVQNTYPLTSTTKQLQESTFLLQSTSTPLNSSSYQVVQTTTPLQQNVFNITVTTSPLQSTTTLVNSTTAPLQSTTSLLNQTIAPLQSTTTLVNSTPYALQSTTTLVTATTSPLQSTTTQVTSTPYKLQSTTTLVTATTSPLQSTTTQVTSTPYKLQSTTTLVTATTSPLQSTTTLLNSTTSPLQRSTSLIDVTSYHLRSHTYLLAVSTYQLQQKSLVSTDGGDTYHTTGWVDASSCTTTGSTPVITGTPGNYVYTKNTTCRYNTAVVTDGQPSCTPKAADYINAQAVTCAYETTPTSAAVASCTTVAQSGSAPYLPSVACVYGTTPTVASGQSSCTANDQTGAASMTGDKVVCTYDAPTTVAAASCSPTASNTGALPQITCGYGAPGAAVHGLSSCTANNQPTNADMTGDKVVCAYDSASAPVAVTTCTATTVATGALPQIACGYGAPVGPSAGADTCPAKDETGYATMNGDKVACNWAATSTTVDAASCTATVSPTTAAKKITCAYSATSGTATTGDTCPAKDETGYATMNGDKVVCSFAATSTTAAVGSCTATVSPTTAATKITCGYGAPVGPSAGADTCPAKDETGYATMNGDKVACNWAATSTTVDAASCTATVSPTTAAKKITCAYSATSGTATTGDTCPAKDETGYATMNGDKVVCSFAATSTTAAVGSCTATVSPTTAATKITCGYGAPVGPSAGADTCPAKDETGYATMNGDKVACNWAATSTTVDAASCTATVSPTTAAKKITCGYNAIAKAATTNGLDTCPANDQTGAATMTGDKIVCAFDAPSTAVGAANCTPTVAPTTSAKKITCGYGTPGATTHGLLTCAANNQPTTGPMSGDQVICGYDGPGAPVNVGTCTPAPATGSLPAVTCGFGTPNATVHGLSSCTEHNPPTTGPVTGDQVLCAYDGPSAPVATGICTPTTVNTAALPQITCGYGTAGAPVPGQTSCAANNQATTAAMSGDKVVCAYDATPTTTTVTSCTAATSATVASPQTTCAFTGTPVVTNPGSCTPFGLTGPTNYTGPQVTCGYTAATRTTNISSCTPVPASVTTTLTPYLTCDYGGAGTTNTGLTSCTVVPQTGPPFAGPAVACAYSSTASSVANVTSCIKVDQDLVNFSAPQKTCAYETVGTSATNLTSCADAPQSTGAFPWSGPSVSCAYSGTATVTNPGSCTVNSETGPSYANGAKVDCAYAAGVASNNVASCTIQAEQTATASGSVYAPARDCPYGATSGWTTATATCDVVPQTGPAFAPARDCQYSALSTATQAASCTAVPQSTGSPYTQLTATFCDDNGGAGFSDVSAAVVTTNVDSCTTALNGVQTGSPIRVSTNTTCTPQTAVTQDATSCSAVPTSTGPDYVTSVSCSNTDTDFIPVAPSCTPVGTPEAVPVPSDFVGGKIVECTKTEAVIAGTGTVAAPIPAPSCTAGTDPTSKVQTSCTTFESPTVAVDPSGTSPCLTAGSGETVIPGAAPSYVDTICTNLRSSSTVMGCIGLVPTGSPWQTITCAAIDGTGTYNTLADVAAYYYYTDLRTTALGNCTGAVVAPAVSGGALCSDANPMNNVPTTLKDPNSAQHMTTFTLGLGASGYMKFSDTYSTDTGGDYSTVYGVAPHAPANGISADPTNGVCSWQSTGLCNWPYPASNEQTTIDDLWHAGVNGHGAYFSATDPKSLSASLSSALSSVAAAGGASASPTISNPSLTPADNYIFSSTYTSVDWTGELVRRQLDPYTGAVSATADWAAQGKLDAKDWTTRNIYTFDSSVAGTKLKAFTSANFAANANFLAPNISTSPTGLTQFLCASVDTCLTAGDQDSTHASGANLVKFLRGDRSNEGALDDNTKYYRQRQHILGDMVDAQAVYVNQPLYNYADPGYSAFVAAQATRQAVVYAGANDGMLHAFAAKGTASTEAVVSAAAAASSAASLDPTNSALASAAAAANATAATAMAADTTIGQEIWSYIPSMVMPNLYQLADKDYKDNHRYYVNATPVVGDICVSDCTLTTAVWKTILVGGLARGGRGYYALDITDPTNPKALWEFTDENLGYSYGNPQIAKMSNGTWAVMFATGYNNIPNEDGAGGDGVGRLYVLDAVSGAQVVGVSPISTGVGTVTSPSGLAKITAQVVNPSSDNTVEAVYGGDLYGNLWRFDINDTVGAAGYDAQLLAVLKDGAGNPQSITTKPEVGLIPTVNVKVVFVGTGRFLAASDASDVSQQTFYAIKDVRATGTTPATAIFDNPGGTGAPRPGGRNAAGFVGQIETEIDCPQAAADQFICDLGTKVRVSTSNPVDFSSDNGWFVDLIGNSERSNTDPMLALGLLAFNTNAPSLAACDVGGKSYQYFLNYLTGGPIPSPGNIDSSTGLGFASKFLANELASSVNLVVSKSGKLLEISGLSGGGINVGQPPLPPPASVTRRTSWRELIREQ